MNSDTIAVGMRVIIVVAGAIALMVWHQPEALLKFTARMEKMTTWLFHRMRVRAWAKAAGMDAYRKAREFHMQEADVSAE